MRKLIYVMVALLMFGCSTDNILKTETQTLERNNGKGKGKQPRVALLTIPESEPSNVTQAITNVMLDPVEYLGELPIDDNGGLVDWDNDGSVDDLISYETRCYFPRSFASVTVAIDGQNPQVINNSIAFGATLLGFADVNGDGLQDIIWAGGNHRKYNPDDNGVIEPYSPYNVGYNSIAEEPTPLSDLVSQLTLTQSVNNPNFFRWDLGSQYDAYVFHVMWWQINEAGQPISPYYQTHSYGEWGVDASYFNGGGTYRMKFSNVADGCEDVTIEFSL